MYQYIVSSDSHVKGGVKEGLRRCGAKGNKVMVDDEIEYTVRFQSALEEDKVDEIMRDAVAELGTEGSVTVMQTDD